MARKAVGPGRPKLLTPAMYEQVYKLCLLGATNAQIAAFFGLSESTMEKRTKSDAEFAAVLRRGKLEADMAVAESLYKQATGYSRVITEKQVDADGKEIKVEREEWIPPSTTAGIFWLKNRARQNWTDVREISGKVKHEHAHRVEGVSETARWIEELVGSGAAAEDPPSRPH